jgi:hypothetical protein
LICSAKASSAMAPHIPSWCLLLRHLESQQRTHRNRCWR